MGTVTVHVMSRETACSAATGFWMDRSGRNRSSIILRTMAVVPIFRNVATSHMLASPMITWSRRYFSGSAWGSSRVLMIGRLSVVSRPTSVSKKSARCVSWYAVWPGSSHASTPTFPAPQNT